MPELPEVEVVRRDLDAMLRGRTVVAVEVGRDRAVRRSPSKETFTDVVRGRAVRGARRVGKFLVVELHAADAPNAAGAADALVIHLGMSGQLLVAPSSSEPRAPHTHVVLSLDDGREVRFVDPRTFGQMFVSAIHDEARPEALAHLGPDALLELASSEDLAPVLAGRRVAVKTRLMDQQAVAGLGNIYSDEILFRAGVRGTRAAGSITDAEVSRIHAACREVLRDAVAARGSSLADAQYVDLYGRPGRFQHAHAVHARAGKPCPRCGAAVARERMGDRFGYWCPGCQS
jgi:formamidopyrimidine-DNA glycosylase